METLSFLLVPSILIVVLIAIVLLIGVSFVYLGLVTMTKRFNRCPVCGQNDAGTIVETVVISTNNYMDHKRNPPSRVIERQLEDHYECEFCQHIWKRAFKESKRTKVKL